MNAWCIMDECNWISSRKVKRGGHILGYDICPYLIKPEWSNCESFSDIQGMSGLNIEVSKNLPIEDGCMRCRDVSLTFTGSSADDFFDVLWRYGRMRVMICMIYVCFIIFVKHKAMYANQRAHKFSKCLCNQGISKMNRQFNNWKEPQTQRFNKGRIINRTGRGKGSSII